MTPITFKRKLTVTRFLWELLKVRYLVHKHLAQRKEMGSPDHRDLLRIFPVLLD